MKTEYYGSDLSRDDLWLREVTLVPQDMRDEEAELMQTRWFDYRDLIPAQATYLFASRYEAMYRESYSMTRDYRDTNKVRPLLNPDVFKGSDLLSLWRARQAADRVGCKYDFYLRFAMRRFWDRGFSYLPRPNQLYGEELILDVADAWEQALQCSLQLAEQGRFKPEAYMGHPDQDAYHLYLVEQIKKREHQHMLLARLVYREKVLPVEVVGKHFSADVLKRAQFF